MCPVERRDAIEFGGVRWTVKGGSGRAVGPGPNYFDNSEKAVWVDELTGALHLRLRHDAASGRWLCAEVIGPALGYGTYRWTVSSPLAKGDPNVMLGLFMYETDDREIDFEFSAFDDELGKGTGQFVLQPYDVPGHVLRFAMPDERNTTHTFRWSQNSLSCQSVTSDGRIIFATARPFEKGVPVESSESRVHINLWLRGGRPPVSQEETEVVISDFSFTSERQKWIW